jgi:hypothetical protein
MSTNLRGKEYRTSKVGSTLRADSTANSTRSKGAVAALRSDLVDATVKTGTSLSINLVSRALKARNDSRLVTSGTDDVRVELSQVGQAGVARTQEPGDEAGVDLLTGSVLDPVEGLSDASGVVPARRRSARRSGQVSICVLGGTAFLGQIVAWRLTRKPANKRPLEW